MINSRVHFHNIRIITGAKHVHTISVGVPSDGSRNRIGSVILAYIVVCAYHFAVKSISRSKNVRMRVDARTRINAACDKRTQIETTAAAAEHVPAPRRLIGSQ